MSGIFSGQFSGQSKRIQKDVEQLREEMTELRMMTALQRLDTIAAKGRLGRLEEAECKVFSQFGEDGIIQYLIRHCEKPAPSFVEFGVENYTEANTRFLLAKDNWRGLVMDSNARQVEQIRQGPLYWRHDLTAVCSHITRDNINESLTKNGFTGEIGLLSIDIDGNDYWVWESIKVVQPTIVIIEFNSVFGAQHRISIPYDANFSRTAAHYSRLFCGASLSAMEYLGQKKGYALVGCNSVGNNAFFVRRDRLGDLTALSASEAYVESKFRESHDQEGRMTYLTGSRRLQEIENCEVVEVESMRKLRIKDLPAK